jgi:tetratricopeptide (TPR) repeat protein
MLRLMSVALTLLLPLITASHSAVYLGCYAGAQQDQSHQQLIDTFRTNSKSDHKAAYEAAKEFFRRYPNDTSEDAKFMKRWMAAYEKVELNPQPSTSRDTSRNTEGIVPHGPETPEIAQARIAITKYKDYQAAIKALQSSNESTKNTSLWVSYMSIAQEGIGNIKEALKYLERYNQLSPGQQTTVEKIADLRYKVSKLEEEEAKESAKTKEEERFGSLEQTEAELDRLLNLNRLKSPYVHFVVSDARIVIADQTCKGCEFCVWNLLVKHIDLQTVRVESSDEGFVIRFNGEKSSGQESRAESQSTYKGKRIRSCTEFEYGYFPRRGGAFTFHTKDEAQNAAIALRHIIRLIQTQ